LSGVWSCNLNDMPCDIVVDRGPQLSPLPDRTLAPKPQVHYQQAMMTTVPSHMSYCMQLKPLWAYSWLSVHTRQRSAECTLVHAPRCLPPPSLRLLPTSTHFTTSLQFPTVTTETTCTTSSMHCNSSVLIGQRQDGRAVKAHDSSESFPCFAGVSSCNESCVGSSPTLVSDLLLFLCLVCRAVNCSAFLFFYIFESLRCLTSCVLYIRATLTRLALTCNVSRHVPFVTSREVRYRTRFLC
jgi:hypothetical protein